MQPWIVKSVQQLVVRARLFIFLLLKMLLHSMAWQTRGTKQTLYMPCSLPRWLAAYWSQSFGLVMASDWGVFCFQYATLLWCNEFSLLHVVCTYFMSNILYQTWDLYSWQCCCVQKLWGECNCTKGQFLYYVALKVASHNLHLTLLPFCRKCSHSVLHLAWFMCYFAVCMCVCVFQGSRLTFCTGCAGAPELFH